MGDYGNRAKNGTGGDGRRRGWNGKDAFEEMPCQCGIVGVLDQSFGEFVSLIHQTNRLLFFRGNV